MFSRGLWSAGQVRAREIAAGMEAEIDTLLKEADEGPCRHGKLRWSHIAAIESDLVAGKSMGSSTKYIQIQRVGFFPLSLVINKSAWPGLLFCDKAKMAQKTLQQSGLEPWLRAMREGW